MVASRRSVFDPNTFEDMIRITSGEILALNTTPKTLIPAPGAGKYIIVDAVEANNVFGTTAYSVDASGIEIHYNGGAPIVTLVQPWAEATAQQIAAVPPVPVLDVPVNTAVEIQALVSDPTLGDGDWTIHIIWREIP